MGFGKSEKQVREVDASDNADYDVEVLGSKHAVVTDEVFGAITEKGPNYRSVGWLGTSVLMMKTQMGLGVLSMPAVFDTLGMIPGVICLIVIAAITTWSDYIVGQWKLAHPDTYDIADVMNRIFGRFGYEIMNFAYTLFWIAVSGSAMLGLSTALNAVSTHGACTAVFVAVAAIVAMTLASIRTLGKISWLAWVGVVSIVVSILTLTISVGIQDRPSAAPQTGEWEPEIKLFGSPSFTSAISAIGTLVFSYAGTPAFFSIVSEMREPRHYTRALITCQTLITCVYLAIGIVVYYFCGAYVASPALGSAGALMKKVCYGLAIPGLVSTVCLVTHLPAKQIFVRLLRGSEHLTCNSITHWVYWLGCVFACTIIAYIIASAVPVFGGLVSLVGALLGTLMCFQPMGCMWLYLHRNDERSTKWYLGAVWSTFVIVAGMFLMVSGTYGSIVDIKNSYALYGGTAAWTCADNSGSV
jgi:amino acid permease